MRTKAGWTGTWLILCAGSVASCANCSVSQPVQYPVRYRAECRSVFTVRIRAPLRRLGRRALSRYGSATVIRGNLGDAGAAANWRLPAGTKNRIVVLVDLGRRAVASTHA